MMSIFLYWWDLISHPVCDLLWRTFHVHSKKYVFSAVLGGNTLNISVKSVWSSVPFEALVSSFIYCLDDLSIAVSGLLKSAIIIVLLSMSFFNFVLH